MYLCMQSTTAALCVAILLLLFVIECRTAKNVTWLVESDSSVFFLVIEIRFNFYVPLGSTVAFTASICLLL